MLGIMSRYSKQNTWLVSKIMVEDKVKEGEEIKWQ